jgi:dGTPase
MQIARSISRALNLNEDLTEAIALGHDLGHTPFGHAGERALDEILKVDGGFRHYEQSVRVVNVLERNGQGLNLTLEVCDGIKNHSGSNVAKTLEGKIVKFADKIAYINHDIDDSLSAKIISEEDIPFDIKKILGFSFKERIDTMIKSVINNSMDKNEINMDKSVFDAMYKLREFLFSSVYFNPKISGQENKINALIKSLFDYYVKNPKKLPSEYQGYIETDGIRRAVTDYIAGMTDRYAIEMYQCLFVPKSFTISKNE